MYTETSREIRCTTKFSLPVISKVENVDTKETVFDMELSISSEYGFVIIVICMTWFLLNWLESRSFQARRRYEVPVSR